MTHRDSAAAAEERIYKLIESERKERIEAIAGIHARLDDLFAVLNKMFNSASMGRRSTDNDDGQASWVRQSIGLTVAVLALVGFLVPTMVSIVRPMQQQIDYTLAYIKDAEARNDSYHASDARKVSEALIMLDNKITAEIGNHHGETNLTNERTMARLNKIEEWQSWWYRDIYPRTCQIAPCPKVLTAISGKDTNGSY